MKTKTFDGSYTVGQGLVMGMTNEDVQQGVEKAKEFGDCITILMSNRPHSIHVDTEVLAFADKVIGEWGLYSNDPHITRVELRIALGARVKEFAAERMKKRLMDWLDEG